jgi:hypothetical protein
LLSIASGAGAGVCAFLLHEWGHLAGARMRGARVESARNLASPFLFSFDSKNNDARQFLSMSFAGFAATGIFLLVFWLWLPLDWLAGRIAMGIALFLASLTVLIEFPLAFRVLRGKALPPVEVFR